MRTLPQRHCRNLSDHPAHDETGARWDALRGRLIHVRIYRCPGRYTPSAHRAPDPSPAQPSDPFAGIDESTEFDATRPAVS